MHLNKNGSLRPSSLNGFTNNEEERILTACPGINVESRPEKGLSADLVWGAYSNMQEAWAADPELRFEASSGGVLTALGASLLKSGKVDFILHVCADPANPMRSKWVMSKTPAEVLERKGSRYGPTSPLAGFDKVLDTGRRFAIIAKPCDLNAVHNLSKSDPRVDVLCVARLALICGGQSRLTKSKLLLDQFAIEEGELTSFRYRGHGNPGSTQIKTKNGKSFEVTYNELWENENTWDLETRCKLCPDALGETADITASDVWPGGGPSGEDDGFNGTITRTRIGDEIVQAAVTGGDLVLGKKISVAQYNEYQPHQLRKKRALKARFDARKSANLPVIQHKGLRIFALSFDIEGQDYKKQFEGTIKRIAEGRMSELNS